MTPSSVELIAHNFENIVDISLREGEQFSGPISEESDGTRIANPHEFSLNDAILILQFLNKIGIKKAEVSNPLAKGMEYLIGNLLALPERPELYAHIRNDAEDLDAALALGVDGVDILTTADPKRLEKMGHTMETYLQVLENGINHAQNHNTKTSIGVEHGWNMPLQQALPIYRLADNLGVNSIRIADTTGLATHWDVRDKVSELRSLFPYLTIRTHFHNDFLEAVSNALEALASGANEVDATLGGGIGERTGTVPLSVLVARLMTLSPNIIKDHNLHPEFLTEADNLVAEIVGIDLPFNVITAKGAFAHRAGLHINQILTDGPTNGNGSNGISTYEPLSPSAIGNLRLVVNGTNVSGRTSNIQVQNFYSTHGKG